MGKYDRGQYVAEFSACNVDLSEAREFIDAYNNDKAYNTGGSPETLFYEHEDRGVLNIPIDDLSRLFAEDPEAFQRFFEDMPDAESIIKDAAKDHPSCEPLLLGMGTKSIAPIA